MKPPFAKLPPLTDAEMRAMWADGDPLSKIAGAARRRNGLGRGEVRRIMYGEPVA